MFQLWSGSRAMRLEYPAMRRAALVAPKQRAALRVEEVNSGKPATSRCAYWRCRPSQKGRTGRCLVNREMFEAWLEQALLPERPPGDIVIMANLNNHKGPGTRAPIESRIAN